MTVLNPINPSPHAFAADPSVDIAVTDMPGPGGAHHGYAVLRFGEGRNEMFPVGQITFQKGALKDLVTRFICSNPACGAGQENDPQGHCPFCVTPDGTGWSMVPQQVENGPNGVQNEDLLRIVEHRLSCFQKGPFACRENAIALTMIQEALMWLNARTLARQQRGVEGKSQQ